MDWYKMAGTALVVGVIGPLFWLGVNVLENKLKGWWSLRRRQRAHAKQAGRSQD